jgi:PAS domain-containing protein
MISPTYHDNGDVEKLCIEDCNERAADMSGYLRSELIGACAVNLF